MSAVGLSRLRKKKILRDLVSETRLLPQDLIMPYFIVRGRGVKAPIKSMPGISHLSIDNMLKDITEIVKLGIKAVLLFGVTMAKDPSGASSYKRDGIVQTSIREIKKAFKDLTVITDVCLCGYTTHGHCRVVRNGRIDASATLKALSKIALSHAAQGADFLSPSAMMDGEVGAIRNALDKKGFEDTGILAYSAKYASSFYGPFREALRSSPQFGDRKTYQMDCRNSGEALREIGKDIEEGADIVMVKPALGYLDIVYRAKNTFNIPVAAYNVSGEYSMVKGYCNGQKRERDIVLEILTGIKRAGADFIITYHAKEAAEWLS